MSEKEERHERPCLHCMMVELIDDFFAENPATASSDKVDTSEADEVLDAIAKTVAELTSQQDGLIRQQVIAGGHLWVLKIVPSLTGLGFFELLPFFTLRRRYRSAVPVLLWLLRLLKPRKGLGERLQPPSRNRAGGPKLRARLLRDGDWCGRANGRRGLGSQLTGSDRGV